MTCKICGAALGSAGRCKACGYEPALDYEQYPTLAPIAAAPSLAGRKKGWEERAGAAARNPEIGGEAPSVYQEKLKTVAWQIVLWLVICLIVGTLTVSGKLVLRADDPLPVFLAWALPSLRLLDRVIYAVLLKKADRGKDLTLPGWLLVTLAILFVPSVMLPDIRDLSDTAGILLFSFWITVFFWIADRLRLINKIKKLQNSK